MDAIGRKLAKGTDAAQFGGEVRDGDAHAPKIQPKQACGAARRIGHESTRGALAVALPAKQD
jgi:hypothetical protein